MARGKICQFNCCENYFIYIVRLFIYLFIKDNKQKKLFVKKGRKKLTYTLKDEYIYIYIKLGSSYTWCNSK